MNPTTNRTIDSLQAWRRVQRRHAVILLFAVAAGWGIVQIPISGTAFPEILGMLGFAVTCTCWFVVDRRVLGNPAVPIVHTLFLFSWPLASLIHLAATRGFRGLGIWMLFVFGLMVVMCATYVPTVLLLMHFDLVDFESGMHVE